MNMTDLLVELIVAGCGAAIWILLLLSTLFDLDWAALLPDQAGSFLVLIPSLSVVYVLGIVWDRAADRLFGVWDKPLRWEKFEDDAGYHRARTYVSAYGTEEIINLFKYHRHRLRICRAWTVNLALLAITIPLVAWVRQSSAPVAVTGFLGCGLLAGACWGTWRRLAANDYQRLAESHGFLVTERGGESGPPD